MRKRAIFIPARLESTRLPRKLLLPTPGGMPLIAKTAKNARLAAELCDADLYVCTDSKDIYKTLEIEYPGSGCQLVYTPKDIDSGTKRVWWAYNELLRNSAIADSYKQIAIIQGDCPNIDPRAIERLFTKTQTVATLCTDRPNCTQEYYASSGIVNVVTDGSNSYAINDPITTTRAIYFTRQYLPYAYRHIGVYLFNNQILRGCLVPQMLERSYLNRCENLEQLCWLENNYDFGCVYIPPDWAGDAIDTQADYDRYCSNLKLMA